MSTPRLIELDQITALADSLSRLARVDVTTQVRHRGIDYPIHGFSIGSQEPTAPVFGLIGGVHGLEAIGAHTVTAYLTTLAKRLEWDETLHDELKKIRLVFMPLVNPVGTRFQWRSNGNGVDLMRNAPVEAEGNASFLVGGHRISPKLPWYRGGEGAPMEAESRALCDFIRQETFQSRFALILDVHSGFGVKDQLWFPYAKTRRPFPHLAEVAALKELLDTTYPNHVYVVEPQAKNYTTHGDLWDHLYDQRREADSTALFLPLTLEMGSWAWVRKNPRQLFSWAGPFNPVKPHRKRRILRRHLPLFDFLIRALLSSGRWAHFSEERRNSLQGQAQRLWYA